MLDWWNYHIINTGRQYTDEMGLTLNLNTPEYNAAVEYIKSLPDAYGGYDKLPENTITFFNGTVGISCMTSSGSSALPQWMAPGIEFGLAPMPGPDDGGEYYLASNGGNLLCIPKKAKNPKGAWMYIKYKMTEAAYVEAVEAYNKTPNLCVVSYITHKPTRERLYKEFESVFTEKSWEHIRARDEVIQKANMTAYTLAVHRKFYNYYMDEFDKVMTNKISPKEYLANMESYGRQLIKEFKEQKTAEGWTFKGDGTVIPPPDEE